MRVYQLTHYYRRRTSVLLFGKCKEKRGGVAGGGGGKLGYGDMWEGSIDAEIIQKLRRQVGGLRRQVGGYRHTDTRG